MILDAILEFEDVINKAKSKDSTNVTWKETSKLEKYVNDIQVAANNLMEQNRKYRKIHMNIGDMIVNLANIDLVKNKSLWKEKLDAIRKVIENTCANKEERKVRLWKIHWDHQIYKALETQYKIGLI